MLPLTMRKLKIKNSTLREILTFVCFFIFAGVMWYGYSMGTVRSMIVPVEVSYQGLSPAIQCEETLPNTIQVEVRDAGHRLKIYVDNPLHITLDITTQVQKEQGEIHISSDVLRSHVANLLQGTTKLQVIQPEQIDGHYYKQHKKDVSIRINGTFSAANQYQIENNAILLRPMVTIYGKCNTLNDITEIATQSFAFTDIRDTMVFDIPLQVPATIQVSDSLAHIQVVGEQFTEKVMTIPVEIRNVPEGDTVRLFPSEVSVILRIGISHFAQLNEHQVKAICYYPTHNVNRLPIHVYCSNQHVTYTRTNPSNVEYIIEK